MTPHQTSQQSNKKRKNGLTIIPDIGWVGSKPAHTREEKIHQIKTGGITDNALLVIGGTMRDFAGCLSISATASTQDLIKTVQAITTETKRRILVITDMDEASDIQQSNVVPLIKDHQILNYTLPQCIQIVMLAKCEENVSQAIKNLSLLIKV